MSHRCGTCGQASPVVMRVVIAAGYNRSLAKPLYNCPACFEAKERAKPYAAGARSGPGTAETEQGAPAGGPRERGAE
ncbi:MAG TPA: hypothetical protein VGB20_05800 [bacterium]